MSAKSWKRPDRETGLPSPPPGPVIGHPRTAKSSWQSFGIIVPAECGPVLAHHRGRRRSRAGGVALAFGVLVFYFSTLDGTWWMRTWQWWAVIAALSGLTLLWRRVQIAVGVEWLQVGTDWVDLCDLSVIDLDEHKDKVTLLLIDGRGRAVRVGLEPLQYNPKVWAFVHHALRGSVGWPTEINSAARQRLGLY